MVRRQHCIELSPHRPDEDGVCRHGSGGVQLPGRGREYPLFLVTEQTRLPRVRVQGAHRDPGVGYSPPLAEGPSDDPAGAHHAIDRKQRRHIPEGHVGGDEHYPERMPARIVRRRFGGKHHGHVYLTGELRQPLGVARVGKAREMKRVFVGGGGYDGIDFAGECQPGRGLDGVAGYAAGADDSIAVAIGISTAELPTADGDTVLRRNGTDLVVRAYHRYVCINRSS
jgi:hypothetical protein